MRLVARESRWRRAGGSALGLTILASPLAAGELELALQGSVALPFYSQSFRLDPGVVAPPEGPIQTSGSFQLDATGGVGFAASLAWHFAGPLALEGRFDSAAIDLEFTGGQATTDLGDLVPGLPTVPIDGSIGGEAVVDRLTPVSLNLHYGTRGRVRFVISGGVSYMPATTIVATAGISLQLGGVPVPSLTLPDVAVTAAATLESSVGGNVGAGVRVPMGGSVSLLFDGRVFGFPERTLEWGRTSGTPSPIEDALADALDPIRFRFGFFQATGGVVLTF